MSSAKDVIERVRELVRESLQFDRAGLSRKRAFWLGLLRLWIQVGKGLVRDKCLQQASSLAYKTVLSVVPFVAVALSLIKAFGGFSGEESALVVFVAEHLLAIEAKTVAGQITKYTEQLSFGAIGGIGVGVLLLVSVSLLDTVDKTLNDVFKSRIKRGWFARFTTYYAVITLGPLLLSVSLYQTARLQSALQGGVVGAISPYLWPVAITWVMLLACYKLFPAARVRWIPAAIGAALAAVGFELVKWGFNVYVAQALLSNYNRIYGAIALVPLFLVWVYVVWIIILFGAEFAYTLQNLERIVSDERQARFEHLDDLARQALVNEHLAIRVMVWIAARYDSGLGGGTVADAANALTAPDQAVGGVVMPLERMGFLSAEEQGAGADRSFVPSRSPDRIRIVDVAAAFREGKLDSGRGDPEWPIEKRLSDAEDAFLDALRGVTLSDMVRDASGEGILAHAYLVPEPT